MVPGGGERVATEEVETMERALALLRKAGYDAYVEYGRLYYRTAEGGVIAVNSDQEAEYLARCESTMQGEPCNRERGHLAGHRA